MEGRTGRHPGRRVVAGGGRRGPVAMCPLRPGEPCTLCQVSVTGPQDCGLVYLVMADPELREALHRHRLAGAARAA